MSTPDDPEDTFTPPNDPEMPPSTDAVPAAASAATAPAYSTPEQRRATWAAYYKDREMPALDVPPDPVPTLDRIRIYRGTDLDETLELALCALQARAWNLYQRGGQLVHLARTGPDSGLRDWCYVGPDVGVVPARRRKLQVELARSAAWYARDKRSKDQGWRAVEAPEDIAAAVLEHGDWGDQVPYLHELVRCPVLRPDGSVLDALGYDTATRAYYAPCREDFETLPATVTRAMARAAGLELLALVEDFPFEGPRLPDGRADVARSCHAAAWLASLLTPFARRAYDGPSPLFLIDKNVRGAGGSLLADVVGVVATGAPMKRLSNTVDDEEMRKRITSLALAGDPTALIDNVTGMLGTPTLDAALTSVSWRDRLLGGNTMATMPLNVVWYATGNNIQLRGDTARRCIHIRLRSDHVRPEAVHRSFRHPDLLQHAAAHRPRYVALALTLLVGYAQAGKPAPARGDAEPIGSFEQWAREVRDAIVWAGFGDVGATRRALTEDSDTDAAVLADLMEGWRMWAGLGPSRPRSAGALADAIGAAASAEHAARVGRPAPLVAAGVERLRAAVEAALRAGGGGGAARGAFAPSAVQVGKVLRQFRERVVRGCRLMRSEARCNRGSQYYVEVCDEAALAEALAQDGAPEDDARRMAAQAAAQSRARVGSSVGSGFAGAPENSSAGADAATVSVAPSSGASLGDDEVPL
jgi:hypothetical protein